MAEEPAVDAQGLARRLNDAIDAHYHPRKRPSDEKMATEITTLAGSKEKGISGVYLWQLRKGKVDNPQTAKLRAIANWLGLGVEDLLRDEVDENARKKEKLLALLSREKVRYMALRADGLSDKSIDGIIAMIESARDIEGLPDAE
jgi:transcriptional regulator with XRE-family HTH domain